MKRYLLGVFAVALAVGFSAFTTNHTAKFDTYFVVGQGGTTSAPTWILSTTDPLDCNSGVAFPCQINVPASEVNNNQILKSDLNESEILTRKESL
jgi:hypothetical protein